MSDLYIQINGKLCSIAEAPEGISKEQAEDIAKGSSEVCQIIKAKSIRKVVHVQDRLINFITE